MNKVQELKDKLLDELIDQFDNGVKVVDKETGEVVKASVDSKIMTVAAKVIKDFQHEAEIDDKQRGQVESLTKYLERRKGLKLA